MILSVSRRTDIPAFFSSWFMNRLNEGFVLVRNPMNYHQVSKISLSPDDIDCIVFWTKDPTHMLDKLEQLSAYTYYFQVSITPYNRSIEVNLQPKHDVIEAFKKLSRALGSDRVVWRYDPIILTDTIELHDHVREFAMIANELEGYTNRCVISFVDDYPKNHKAMTELHAKRIYEKDMLKLGEIIAEIGRIHHMEVSSCCEEVDLSRFGINKGKCIDDTIVSQLLGQTIHEKKDINQRGSCGCITSVDIGAYDSCQHGCLYCYATNNKEKVIANYRDHDPMSAFLIGHLEEEDVIKERWLKSLKNLQIEYKL